MGFNSGFKGLIRDQLMTNKTGKVRINVIFRQVLVTIVAVEMQ